jgi:hypothetical protein
MPQDWPRYVAHVVRCCEVATAQRRQRFGTEEQRHGSARTCAIKNRRVRARASYYLNHVVLHAGFHARVAYLHAAARDGVRLTERPYVNGFEPTRVEARIPIGDDLSLGVFRRIVEQDF